MRSRPYKPGDTEKKNRYADINKYKKYRRGYKKRLSTKTQEAASNKYQPYTIKELELISDYNFSAQQLAKMLNRSYYGIVQQRHKLNKEKQNNV